MYLPSYPLFREETTHSPLETNLLEARSTASVIHIIPGPLPHKQVLLPIWQIGKFYFGVFCLRVRGFGPHWVVLQDCCQFGLGSLSGTLSLCTVYHPDSTDSEILTCKDLGFQDQRKVLTVMETFAR